MSISLAGRNVIVTGGSNGIGLAIVRKAVACGANVLILDIDEKNGRELEMKSENITFYQVDLADRKQLITTLHRILESGMTIHGLVNNAGILSRALIENLDYEEWDQVLAVNLTAPFITCKEIYPHMKQNCYGKIVNISSVAGKCGGIFSGKIAYGSSKAGVLGITKSLAREGAPFGVRTNAICPAAIDTAMTSRSKEMSEGTEINQKRHCPVPLGRKGTPEEVANLAIFLLSEESDFINGETVVIDGGMTMCS